MKGAGALAAAVLAVVGAGRAQAQCSTVNGCPSGDSLSSCTSCDSTGTCSCWYQVGSQTFACTADCADCTSAAQAAANACPGSLGGGVGGGNGGGSTCSTPCGADCCDGIGSCCGGSCCGGTCCNGTTCVVAGGTCCGSGACYDGDSCCSGSCARGGGPCCGSGACKAGEVCCGGQCFPSDTVCCPDGTSCPSGGDCSNGCAPSGATNCGGSYCPQVEACMAATPGLVAGSFVCIDGTPCGGGFCDPSDTCSNGTCLAPGLVPCGGGACNGNAGEQCCGGSCISSGQRCCNQGGTSWVCGNGLTCQSCVVNGQQVYSCGVCPGGTAPVTGTSPAKGSAPLGPDAGKPATPVSSPKGSAPSPGTVPGDGSKGGDSWLGLGFSCGGGGSGGGSPDGGGGGPRPSCGPVNLVLGSNASTLAAAVPVNSPSLDAGDAGGLTFASAYVGANGSAVGVPPGAPTGAGVEVVNVSSTPGASGFFEVTFDLPSGFTKASLKGAANVDDQGRVFLNGTPLTPAFGASGAVSESGNVAFSASGADLVSGTNVLLVADNNAGGGPSGAAFWAVVAYLPPCTGQADLPGGDHGRFAELGFLLIGLFAFLRRGRR